MATWNRAYSLLAIVGARNILKIMSKKFMFGVLENG
jgi:hypothetical protein